MNFVNWLYIFLQSIIINKPWILSLPWRMQNLQWQINFRIMQDWRGWWAFCIFCPVKKEILIIFYYPVQVLNSWSALHWWGRSQSRIRQGEVVKEFICHTGDLGQGLFEIWEGWVYDQPVDTWYDFVVHIIFCRGGVDGKDLTSGINRSIITCVCLRDQIWFDYKNSRKDVSLNNLLRGIYAIFPSVDFMIGKMIKHQNNVLLENLE